MNEPVRSFNNTGLAPLTRYQYRVVAYRPGGPSTGYASTSIGTTQLNFPYKTGYGRGVAPSGDQGVMDGIVKTKYNAWRALSRQRSQRHAGCHEQ
ncbi:hypothetical protein [Massilia glaciei]|uniref:hypothetical protein n=1 Tax=Massilia glaciei TaxID=1524097 RepID=UPI0015E80147|nr:hypothetical protein [Massilia glaciei]